MNQWPWVILLLLGSHRRGADQHCAKKCRQNSRQARQHHAQVTLVLRKLFSLMFLRLTNPENAISQPAKLQAEFSSQLSP